MREEELRSWRDRCVGEIDRLIDEVRRLQSINEHLTKQTSSPPQRVHDQPPMQPVRVSEPEAAKLLGICPRTLFRRRVEGKIAFIKDGERVFYEVEEISRYSREASKRMIAPTDHPYEPYSQNGKFRLANKTTASTSAIPRVITKWRAMVCNPLKSR